MTSSRRILLKLRIVTGMGLPQPTTGPTKPVNTRLMTGMITEPQGSMCLDGFNVTRPSI